LHIQFPFLGRGILKDQITLIRSVFTGKLDAKAKENPPKAETVEELLLFNLFHESIHIGTIHRTPGQSIGSETRYFLSTQVSAFSKYRCSWSLE
jgi:hypothetical protein